VSNGTIGMHARTQEVNDATYAAWNAHDADAVAAVFAEDAVLIEAGSPNVLRGRDSIRARAVALLTALPDFHLERGCSDEGSHDPSPREAKPRRAPLSRSLPLGRAHRARRVATTQADHR